MVVHGIGTASTVVTEREETGEIRLVGSPPPETVEEEPTNSTKTRRGVKWQEGTVDNEHLNRKKSKICCIFHPQRSFDDEDCSCHSDSGSGSDSDSDSDSNTEGKPDSNSNGKPRRKQKKKSNESTVRSSSPNAYEKQPKYPHKHSVHKQ